MNKGLLLLLLSALSVGILLVNSEAKEPTAANYLEAARIQYNDSTLQLEDIYESLSFVGIGPAPVPDKLEVKMPQ